MINIDRSLSYRGRFVSARPKGANLFRVQFHLRRRTGSRRKRFVKFCGRRAQEERLICSVTTTVLTRPAERNSGSWTTAWTHLT